jgi:hypothetical protein
MWKKIGKETTSKKNGRVCCEGVRVRRNGEWERCGEEGLIQNMCQKSIIGRDLFNKKQRRECVDIIILHFFLLLSLFFFLLI